MRLLGIGPPQSQTSFTWTDNSSSASVSGHMLGTTKVSRSASAPCVRSVHHAWAPQRIKGSSLQYPPTLPRPPPDPVLASHDRILSQAQASQLASAEVKCSEAASLRSDMDVRAILRGFPSPSRKRTVPSSAGLPEREPVERVAAAEPSEQRLPAQETVTAAEPSSPFVREEPSSGHRCGSETRRKIGPSSSSPLLMTPPSRRPSRCLATPSGQGRRPAGVLFCFQCGTAADQCRRRRQHLSSHFPTGPGMGQRGPALRRRGLGGFCPPQRLEQ